MSASGLIGWFTAVSVLSIASRIAVRDGVDERCRLDGRAVEPVRRIDLVDGEHVVASFCSTDCALAWPDVPAGATWQVRDEITGRPLDASRACFVRGGTGELRRLVHSFERPEDARLHGSRFGGAPIPNPFATTRFPDAGAIGR